MGSSTTAHRGTPVDVRDAWRLTALISPRRVVRASACDVSGKPVNCYPLVHPTGGNPPLSPWAVHLTDPQGRFRLLCADLDARPSKSDAERDAAHLSRLLTQMGIAHVVCESGPAGGRHVWIALAEAVDPPLVAALARLLKAWLPTLDTAPLLNPRTGCVRPPGSPHRHGGVSRVLSGTLATLTAPQVRVRDVEALVSHLAVRVNTTTGNPRPTLGTVRQVDVTDGIAHLAGPRRALPAAMRVLLDTVPAGDASAVLWRLLCSAALARWRFADVLTVKDRPGLEHARTLKAGDRRVPRPATGSGSPEAVLLRQWNRAVAAMSRRDRDPNQPGSDPTFDARAEGVTDLVDLVQRRADLAAGRWRGARGAAHRRVLDTVCLFHLQAVRGEVEADIRRVALSCGLDRETARRALLVLAEDGWLRCTRPAAGVRGAVWTIDPHGVLHRTVGDLLSQGNPRPPGTGAALRSLAITRLTDRLEAAAHDAFSPHGGLGPIAGALYGRLATPLSTLDVAHQVGCDLHTAHQQLHSLAGHGLVERHGSTWRRTGPSRLDRVADDLGTHGQGRQRAELYRVERALWAWWLAEVAWMSRPHPATAKTLVARHLTTSQPQESRERPHPRTRTGRADYPAARQLLRTPTDRGTHVPQGDRPVHLPQAGAWIRPTGGCWPEPGDGHAARPEGRRRHQGQPRGDTWAACAHVHSVSPP